jgi:hypothetical protein
MGIPALSARSQESGAREDDPRQRRSRDYLSAALSAVAAVGVVLASHQVDVDNDFSHRVVNITFEQRRVANRNRRSAWPPCTEVYSGSRKAVAVTFTSHPTVMVNDARWSVCSILHTYRSEPRCGPCAINAGSQTRFPRIRTTRASRRWLLRTPRAIYAYLNAVYGLVSWWAAEERAIDRARRALRLQRLEVSKREDPFAAIIRCTADPAKADKRTRSKWSRVMRYAAAYKSVPNLWTNRFRTSGPIRETEGRHQPVRGSVLSVPGTRCPNEIPERGGQVMLSLSSSTHHLGLEKFASKVPGGPVPLSTPIADNRCPDAIHRRNRKSKRSLGAIREPIPAVAGTVLDKQLCLPKESLPSLSCMPAMLYVDGRLS